MKPKIYQVVLPEEPTVKDVAAVLSLMTITMEVGAGDETSDKFVADHPHLVVDITVAHEQSQQILEAFDEIDTDKKNLS